MKTLNIIILFFIGSTFILFAQKNDGTQNDFMNTRVYGYVVYDGQNYLATEQGFLPVENSQNINDRWRDYYRKIYGDSTLINPNTIISEQNSQFPVELFVPLDISKYTNQQYSFTDQQYISDFIRVDSNGGFNYQPNVQGIIGSLGKRNGLKLPKVK